MTDAKLQPCPFCGEHLTQDSRMMMASCETVDCYMRGLAVDLEDADSVERWNRRTPLPDALVEVQRVRAAHDNHEATNTAEAERDAALARVVKLREALVFYADRNCDGYDVAVTNYGLSTEEGPIIRDGGDIARAALDEDVRHG